MRTKLSLLPRRSPLQPGESLPSLLTRLEAMNYYTPGTIKWLCHKNLERKVRENMAWPHHAITYVQLAKLTGITPFELFDATKHRFASILKLQDSTHITLPNGEVKALFNNRARRMQTRQDSNMQFCPLCLKESSYHRLSWVLTASAICLKHRCLLMLQCPQCSKRVSLAEVVKAHCKTCDSNLYQAPIVSVADDRLGILSQQFLQFWLTVAPEPTKNLPLPKASPTTLYYLLEGLRLSLTACQENWSHLPDPLAGLNKLVQENAAHQEPLPPAAIYHLYRAAFKVILDWPLGFYGFLDAYHQRNTRSETEVRLGKLFGTLFTRWIQKAWRSPEFEFIQQTFTDYLFSGRVSLIYALRHERFKNDARLTQMYGLVNKEQAAQILGLSKGAVGSLAWSGRLRPARVPVDHTNVFLLKHDMVLDLAREWENGLRLMDVRCCLGLTESVIRRLVEIGALRLEGNNSGYWRNWLFNWQSISEFVSAIANKLKPLKENTVHRVSLSNALSGYVPLDKAELLKMIADDQIQGYKLRSWQGRLSTVYFDKTEIKALIKAIIANRGWISDEQLSKQIGASRKAILALWRKDGSWPQYGLRLTARYDGLTYFDPQVVKQFCANCLTSKQTAQILGISRTTLIRRFVSTQRIHTIANPRRDGSRCYLFWRKDVMWLRKRMDLMSQKK